MNVGDAVSAPRVHHQWLPDRLMVERGGFEAATLSELRRMDTRLWKVTAGVMPMRSARLRMVGWKGLPIGAGKEKQGGFSLQSVD